LRKLLTILSVTTLLLVGTTSGQADNPHRYGPTTPTDHLWHIAQDVRPSREVSKQQTMVAILRANPHAFNTPNVNALRAGYMLRIPTTAEIKAIPPISALVQVSAQNSAWLNHVDIDPAALRAASKAPAFGTLRNYPKQKSAQPNQNYAIATPKLQSATKTSTLGMISPPNMNAVHHNEASTSASTKARSPVETINPTILNTAQRAESINANATTALKGAHTTLSSTPHENSLSDSIANQQFLAELTGPTGSLDSLLQVARSQSTGSAIDSMNIRLNSQQVGIPVQHAASNDFNTPIPGVTHPTSFITAATAETLIKNGIATHISNLSQKLDDFLIKFNQLESNTKQKLDVIEDEHVAMKNQIASLDKQLKQLTDNYLQYSTPVLHRSAFSDYGIWIMGSSVLACLLVLIFTLSRRRQLPAPERLTPRVTPVAPKPTLSEEIDEIEDEYDYLGSREGIAAKLDLASAYIDMGDIEQAMNVLNEVINHGNEEQQYAARQILSAIMTLDTVH
jgi:FimV-like protein